MTKFVARHEVDIHCVCLCEKWIEWHRDGNRNGNGRKEPNQTKPIDWWHEGEPLIIHLLYLLFLSLSIPFLLHDEDGKLLYYFQCLCCSFALFFVLLLLLFFSFPVFDGHLLLLLFEESPTSSESQIQVYLYLASFSFSLSSVIMAKDLRHPSFNELAL